MQQLADLFFRAVKDKDLPALDALFTEDAVYIDRNGETYNGLSQIREWFSKLISDGEVRAWDIRRIRDGAVEWSGTMSTACMMPGVFPMTVCPSLNSVTER